MALYSYVSQRIAQSLFVLLGVSVAVFGAMFLTGDPVRLLAPIEASPEYIEELRVALGFADPLPLQYWRFIRNAAQGDFGKSIWIGRPALHLVLERLPATVELALASIFLAVLIAIPLGVVSAILRNTIVDRLAVVISVLGQATPTFWLGIVLILVFSVKLDWLPAFGRTGVASIVLPAMTLAAYSTARLARFTRSSVLEVLHRDFVRTARSKGLPGFTVLAKHVMKNASLPIVTLVGLELGVLLGGAVITEAVFAWPGIGQLALQAVYQRDYPLVQAAVFLVALIFVTINLIVDLTYAWLNPRIRLS